MRQFIENFFRFFYDQDYQASIRWVKWATELVSPIHQHIWTSERFPAGVITVLIYHHIDPWLALVFFIFSALTDWFDGKVARYRQNPKHIMIGWIDKYIQRLGEKKNKNLIERTIASENFGDIFDGAADKFFIIPIVCNFVFHLGISSYYWPLAILMSVIDIFGTPMIKVLDKMGKIKSGGKIYKHSPVGKIKYALQVVLVLLLLNTEMHPFKYQEIAINFTLSIATVLSFFSVFCKISPVICQKIWQSNGN